MISLNALDKLATDHLVFLAQCSTARQGTKFSTPPTDPQVAAALADIRQLILNGSLDEAVSVIEALCPDALKNPELQLELRIHKLFELVHKTQLITMKENPQQYKAAVQQALRFSQDLADFALHAFPDAYAKFTKSMMLFAFPDQAVSSDSLTKKRDTLAGNLVSLVRMMLGSHESCLSLVLRYLLVIYLQLRIPLNSNDKESTANNDIVGDLLPWRVCEDGHTAKISWAIDDADFVTSEALEDYSVAEVQALRERVNITRQQSVLSLRFAKGDTFAALRNELGRLKLKDKLFEVLVMDYCTARGLEGFEMSGKNNEDIKERFPTVSSSSMKLNSSPSNVSMSSLNMSVYMRKLRILAKQTDCSDVHHVNSIEELIPDISQRLGFRLNLRRTLCSLGNDDVAESIRLCRDKIGPATHKCPDLLPLLSDTLLLVVYAHDYRQIIRKEDRTKTENKDSSEEGTNSGSSEPDNTEIQTNSRFEALIADACARVTNYSSADSILRDAYESLEDKFGEPRLVQLLRKLLDAHDEWQKKNFVKDQFAVKLGIDSLQHGLPLDTVQEHSTSSIKRTINKMSTERTNNETVAVQRYEETILALMEFLAMTRAEALSAVRNHPHANDPHAMVDYVLTSMM